MSNFYNYDELVTLQPMRPDAILRIAAEVTELPPFREGVAVLCGSVAWSRPVWRSDIDVIVFATESFANISTDILAVIERFDRASGSRSLLPKSDVIPVGEETRQLVTRKNLVRGSAPIEELQTVREIFAAASLRFADHVNSLASTRGEPWRTFHSTYLANVSQDSHAKRNAVQNYVTSFADKWRQHPLDPGDTVRTGRIQQEQLDAMGHVENFSIHLMRQILSERGIYPQPDLAPQVRASFAKIEHEWAQQMLAVLEPFLLISQRYEEIVQACWKPSPITASEYYNELSAVFGALSFDGIEEATWNYLSSAS